jgi:hypothetical protein
MLIMGQHIAPLMAHARNILGVNQGSMPLHACNSIVFASVNGDTPRHFNSHLTLRISATEKSASLQNIAVIAHAPLV